MLVLSRKKNESIWIGDVIEVMVLEVRGDKVRLGVNAPLSFDVHRGEVRARIEAGNRALDDFVQAAEHVKDRLCGVAS